MTADVSIPPIRLGNSRRVTGAVFAALALLLGACSDSADDTNADSSVGASDITSSSADGSSTVTTESTSDDDSSVAATNDDSSIVAGTSQPPVDTTDSTPTTLADDSETFVPPTLVVPIPGPTVPTPIDDEADFGTGVVAAITGVEAIEVTARLPGERSGPGVLVTIEITNDSTEAISLDFMTVDLIGNDGSSATPIEAETPSAFTGELAAGASAVGKYQFFIPVDQRQSATITVNYAVGVPTALFSGDLPNA